jgi:hypothetical protein
VKGIVMRSFIDYVDDAHGARVADEIASLKHLASGGAFTTVGYYPVTDLLAMAEAASQATGVPLKTLIYRFGRDLYGRLHRGHSQLMAAYASPIEVLSSLEAVIHVNVRKLYDNAELPTFEVKERDGNRSVTLLYQSSRPFADLAAGLIAGCLDHFGLGDHSSIDRYDLRSDGTATLFTVTVQGQETNGGDSQDRRDRAP